ncbi:MAG: ferritin-like domain-containing protein [Leptolyngbya sp. SIO3F4]|nr:ferritin-like domain-containing protein [Leptolyngbya sp. SIO3F4]
MLHASEFWVQHFETNLQENRIDWDVTPQISEDEKRQILYSLKAWQLGETSEGKQLLAAASKYAKRQNDPAYLEAIRLFIREEQKHGANLGSYLDRIGEPRSKRDLGDSLFRWVRHLNTSMECWTITVIIVEGAAQVFYQALHHATSCTLLRSICRDILQDESYHIPFQHERLFVLFRQKGVYGRIWAVTWYCLLFFVTIHAVWFGHRRAFLAGGVSRGEFMRQMYYKFFTCLRFLHRSPRKQTHFARLSIT